jgi:hypothetical protein
MPPPNPAPKPRTLFTQPLAAASAGWRWQVRLRGPRHWSGVVELLAFAQNRMFKRIINLLTFGLLCRSGSADAGDEIDIENDPELRSAFQEIGKIQASGLDGATVAIHSVREHAAFHGATPNTGHILVVVDVTFKDHKTGFGLAGIELLDAEREAQSLGGDPHQVYLEEDGGLMKDQSGGHLVGPMDWKNDKPIRVCLVYSVPKGVRKIALGYWGRVIVERSFDVTGPV